MGKMKLVKKSIKNKSNYRLMNLITGSFSIFASFLITLCFGVIAGYSINWIFNSELIKSFQQNQVSVFSSIMVWTVIILVLILMVSLFTLICYYVFKFSLDICSFRNNVDIYCRKYYLYAIPFACAGILYPTGIYYMLKLLVSWNFSFMVWLCFAFTMIVPILIIADYIQIRIRYKELFLQDRKDLTKEYKNVKTSK